MAQRHPHPGWWSLTLYPDAGEASGSFHASIRRGALGKGAGRAEPERAKREAERRAAAKLRRYCSANHLDRLGTLTYAEPCFDTKQMRGHVGGFFKRLKRELGGNPFPIRVGAGVAPERSWSARSLRGWPVRPIRGGRGRLGPRHR